MTTIKVVNGSTIQWDEGGGVVSVKIPRGATNIRSVPPKFSKEAIYDAIERAESNILRQVNDNYGQGTVVDKRVRETIKALKVDVDDFLSDYQ